MYNEQQQQTAAMTEEEFIHAASMFKPEERAALLESMRAAVEERVTA